MKLYDFWRSTAGYRVRIALNLKGLAVERVEVDLFTGQHQSATYAAINPQGMVPALELDDGTLLTQSLPIIDYLDAIAPEVLITPTDPVLRAKVQAAAYAVAIDIHPVQNMAVSKRVEALAPGSFQSWIEGTMTHRLPGVEALLSQNDGPYCFGDQVTLADVCLIPQLFNAKAVGLDLSPYPRLTEIDAACLALSAFKDAEPREPQSS